MKTSHTPGPWTVPHLARDEISCNCRYVFAEDYLGGIGEVYVDNGKAVSDGGNDCPPIDEAKANAKLIAAAPDLLEALQAMQQALTIGTQQSFNDAVSQGFKAIAKATGGQS